MPPAVQNAQPSNTEQSAQQSPNDAGLALLEQAMGEPGTIQETTNEQPTESSQQDNSETSGDTKDEPSELEKALAAPEKKPLQNEQVALKNQHAALTRRTAAIEKREAKLLERERELDSIQDLASHVALVAKRTGRDPDSVWGEFVEMAKNNGRRPPEKELLHEVRQLRAEVSKGGKRAETPEENEESAELEQEQTPGQPSESELKESWKTSVNAAAAGNAERWPSLAQYPDGFVGAAALDVVERYFEKTGKVPDQESVLDYLEKQAVQKSAAAAKPAAAKPTSGAAKPKATTVTNKDASTPIDARALSQEEREELANKQLAAQLRL